MCCTLPYPTQPAAIDAMMIVSKTLEAGGAMSSHHASGQEAQGQVGLLRVAPEAPGESVRALRLPDVPCFSFFQWDLAKVEVCHRHACPSEGLPRCYAQVEIPNSARLFIAAAARPGLRWRRSLSSTHWLAPGCCWISRGIDFSIPQADWSRCSMDSNATTPCSYALCGLVKGLGLLNEAAW